MFDVSSMPVILGDILNDQWRRIEIQNGTRRHPKLTIDMGIQSQAQVCMQ